MKRSEFFKRSFSAILSCAAALSLASGTAAYAEVTPNPVISRNCPAFSSNQAAASQGNDEHYFSFWNAASPDYLAYDLSDVPESKRKSVMAVWYNTSSYDAIGMYQSSNMIPSDYVIEVNAAPGGTYPEDGWRVVDIVEDNKLSSRQHLIDFEGSNWIRMRVLKADGEEGKNVSINLDIHNVSEGVSDSWLFLGDSITAGGMNNCYGTGYATYVNRLDDRYFPLQVNGGIGGIRSEDGKNNIERWVQTFPGRYVSIAYGTNDAWGSGGRTGIYYTDTKYMIDCIIDYGKIPVLPTIPYSTNPDVGDYLEGYNDVVKKLYDEYGEQLVKGPDFYTIFKEHPEYLSSDGVHPNDEGYDQMRQIWAKTMYETVYTSSNGYITDILTIERLSDLEAYVKECSKDAKGKIVIPETFNGKKITYIGNDAFRGCENITSVTIPGSVEAIGLSAFENCPHLEEVSIGSGVEDIADFAFHKCESLVSVVLPESVEHIGRDAFSGCESLSSVTIKNRNCVIDDLAISNEAGKFIGTIYGSEGSTAEKYANDMGYRFETIAPEVDPDSCLTFDITLDESGYELVACDKDAEGSLIVPSEYKGKPVVAVGPTVFQGCSKLKEVTFAEGIKEIYGDTFYDCESLETVNLPKSLENIEAGVFMFDPNLKAINVAEGNKEFFSKDGVLYSKNENIGYFRLIKVPDAYAEDTFVVPEGVNVLMSYAMHGCKNITSVKLPDSLGAIDNMVFFNTQIEEINIPKKVFSVDANSLRCSSLRVIYVDEKNELYRAEGGVLFNKDMTKLIKYPENRGAKSYNIPETVKVICREAFENTDLAYIDVPENVEELETYAFFSPNLTRVTVKNPVCKFYDNGSVIANLSDRGGYLYNGVIEGYENSTAQRYAERFGYDFKSLGKTEKYVCGDANDDGEVTIDDAVLIMQALANPDKYGVGGTDENAMTEHGKFNADCYDPGSDLTARDALSVQKYLLGSITELPEVEG